MGNNNNQIKTLNKKQQEKLSDFIVECEIEKMHTNLYEEKYEACTRELDTRPTKGSKILAYLLMLGIGFAVGVNQ